MCVACTIHSLVAWAPLPTLPQTDVGPIPGPDVSECGFGARHSGAERGRCTEGPHHRHFLIQEASVSVLVFGGGAVGSERPIGAAKGKQISTMAPSHPPPPTQG